MKKSYSKECEVAWTCDLFEESGCTLDTSGCPISSSGPWMKLSGGECSPPEVIPGSCMRAVNFAVMSKEEKLRWASDCDAHSDGVYWPCEGSRVTPPSFYNAGPRVSVDVSGPLLMNG